MSSWHGAEWPLPACSKCGERCTLEGESLLKGSTKKAKRKELRERLPGVVIHTIMTKTRKKFPQIGDEYWWVCKSGIYSLIFNNDIIDRWNIKTNNFFQTKEQAQAKRDLINHIAEFEEPKINQRMWYFGNKGVWDDFRYEGIVYDRTMLQAGLVIPFSSTEKDRVKRLKLLKKVYA